MPTPLVMLGPGGDYATRIDVKGTALRLTRGASTAGPAGGTNPDADARGHHGYQRPPAYPTPTPAPGNAAGRGATSSGGISRPADSFDLTAPLHAAAAWLDLQSLTLGDQAEQIQALMASVQAALPTSESLPTSPLKPARPPAFVRALRAAKARLRQAEAESPSTKPQQTAIIPVAAPFAAAGSRSHPSTSSSSPLRSLPHEPDPQAIGHPQPHPRDPADPRLFADDAGARRRARRLQGHRLRARRSPDQKGRPRPAGQQSALFGSLA